MQPVSDKQAATVDRASMRIGEYLLGKMGFF